jgi:Skp family chaperone for outer membrane proteins
MKKLLLFICVIFFIAIKPAYSFISDKVGFFEMQRVVVESDAGKKAEYEFREIINTYKPRIEEVERDLKTRKEDLEKKRSTTDEQKWKEMESDYQQRFKKYQKLIKDTNEELQSTRKSILEKLIPQIMKVVERIKIDEKYTTIFEKDSQGSKGENITNKVIKEFNVYTMIYSTPVEVVSTAPPISSDIDNLPLMKATQNQNAYAIVIGIEQYRQKLPKADYAVSDAKLVSEYLSRVMGYPEQNIITLTGEHAAKSDFEKYFEKWLPNNVEKDSTVFIYYSGHGAPNPKTGDAYLVPYDGDPSFIDQTGYSLKRMYDALGKLQAKEIIVALDSCFSGAGGRSVLAKGARPLVMNLQENMILSKNMTVMSASSGDQISSTYEEKGHGLFTYFMLKGIKNEAVIKQDGSIKMEDLFGYLKPQVERIARKQFNNEQTPQLIEAKKN